jgi:DNA-binding MurR/RpiR family transcriptional regulator
MAVRARSPGSVCLLRIERSTAAMRPTERRVADYIRTHPEEVIRLSVTALAEVAQASEATVVRLCQRLGYQGYQELKIALARELANPLALIHEDIQEGDGPRAVIAKVFASHLQTLELTRRTLDPHALARAAQALAEARRVEIFALGTSVPIALDLHGKVLRIGVPSTVTADAHLMAVAARQLGRRDVAVGISHSGASRDVVEAVRAARLGGATTIALTNFGRSPLTRVAEIRLFTASQETRFRSEPLVSRLAQMAVVDALFVAVALQNPAAAVRHMRTVEEALVDKKRH